MNACEKTVQATEPKIVWANETGPRWRIVSNGQWFSIERAGTKDAMGVMPWKKVSTAEAIPALPAEALVYIASAFFANPATITPVLFAPELCEHTPSIVRELAGQSVEFAARIMSIALREQEQGMKALNGALKTRTVRLPEEGLFECTVRTLAELTTKKSFAEARVAELERGAEKLSNTIADIEVGLILRGAMPVFKPLRSLNERALTMIEYLSRVLVKTTIATETVTTTVARQEPVLPHC